ARGRGGEWEARLAQPTDVEVAERSIETMRIRLGSAAEKEPVPSEIAAIADALEGSLDIENGPLVRIVAVEGEGSSETRLWIFAHHLVADAVSLRIILDELSRGLRAEARGESIEAALGGAPSVAFAEWTRRLASWAASLECERECAAWLEVDPGIGAEIPCDGVPARGFERDARRVRRELDARATSLLLAEANDAYRTRPDDLLRSALLRAVLAWSGRDAIWLDVEGHGREPIDERLDVSGTVGWFTSLAPVLLTRGASGRVWDDIKSVKEAVRRLPRA